MVVDDGLQVSFIIPACNAANTLLRAIRSILTVDVTAYEIIIVCNNCEDDTAAIAENFKTVNGLQLLHIYSRPEINGVSSARNVGIAYARGKWVCFVDADDYIAAVSFESLLAECRKFDSPELMIAPHWLCKDGQVSLRSHGLDRPQLLEREQILQYLHDYCYVPYVYTLFVHCWGKLYSREKIITNNITFDEKFTQLEDVNFNLKYLKTVDRVYYSNSPFYFYDTDSNIKSLSVSSGRELNAMKNVYMAIKPVKYFMVEVFEREDCKRAMSQLMTSIGRIWIIRISKNPSLSISQSVAAIDNILASQCYRAFQVRYTCRGNDSKLLDLFCRYSNASIVTLLLHFKLRWRF